MNILGICVRCVCVLGIFSHIFSDMTMYMMRIDDETNEIHAFYEEAENSIDVLYIGSSPVLRGISPMFMYETYGFTGYARASALQAPIVSYYLLEESLRYQNPQVVVFSADNIFAEYDYEEREADLRRAVDGMKPSIEKFEIAKKATEEDDRQTILSYFFPLLRYHDRWKELELQTMEPQEWLEESILKGHVFLKDATPQEYPENFMEATGEIWEYDAEAVYYFEKMIRLCQERGISVLIAHLPKMSWTYEQSQALETFAMRMNVDYIDFDVSYWREILNLNLETDYYDQGHMTASGSYWLSLALGEYLSQQYRLPNRRYDIFYQDWNEKLMVYKEKTGLFEW